MTAHMAQNKVNQPPTQSANVATGITEDQIHRMITSAISNHNHNSNKPNHDNSINNNQRGRNTKLKVQALIDGILVTNWWSHGITQNLYHNSCTCKRKNEDHKDEATDDNRMDSSSIALSERS